MNSKETAENSIIETISHNVNNRRFVELLKEIYQDSCDVATGIENKELLESIIDFIIKKYGEKQLRIFKLYFIEERTITYIAREYNCKEENIENIITRIKGAIKKNFSQNDQKKFDTSINAKMEKIGYFNLTPKEQEEFIINNRPLVFKIAQSYFKHNGKIVELEDLIGIGEIALVDAAQRFKPSLGNKFSTYAMGYINGLILNYINKERKKASRISTYFEDKINSSSEKFDSDDEEMAKLYRDKHNTEEKIEKKVLTQSILDFIRTGFDEREYKIIILFFYNQKTMTQIATIFKTTRANISRIIDKVLKEVRLHLGYEIPKGYKIPKLHR